QALHLQRADARFDAARFVEAVAPRLEALELKARAQWVADALEAVLPADVHAAAEGIERALASVRLGEQPSGAPSEPDGLTGWMLWPVGEFVARRGLAHPERALTVLHAITQRFTAEFAIRPFLERHPALVFGTLARWVHD
ncbi:MAG: DNA alkylation repair protein, partial [Gemmatimonadaceae bacterium]